jgi:hypothetical protein
MELDREGLIGAAIHRRWHEYYRPIWRKRQETGQILSWNFAAFFLGWLWLSYRQQYVALLCEIGLAFAAKKLSLVTGKPAILIVWTVVVHVALGLLGNQLLFWTIERDIALLQQSGSTPDKIVAALLRKHRTMADNKLW